MLLFLARMTLSQSPSLCQLAVGQSRLYPFKSPCRVKNKLLPFLQRLEGHCCVTQFYPEWLALHLDTLHTAHFLQMCVLYIPTEILCSTEGRDQQDTQFLLSSPQGWWMQALVQNEAYSSLLSGFTLSSKLASHCNS